MAWSMSKEEYTRLKDEGWKDHSIAMTYHVSKRTFERWKEREGINDSLRIRMAMEK